MPYVHKDAAGNILAVYADPVDRDKMYADVLLRAEEMEKKYDTAVDVQAIRAAVEENRLARS